ncbi:MAG: hypothetical protein JWO38_477 [Gemmataceae bacterium]|nr:hypothetical protein [Gemmataceae bacterium]
MPSFPGKTDRPSTQTRFRRFPMRRLVTLLGVALAPACIAADGPRAEETEYKRLDGTWRIVASEKDGVEQPPDQLPDRLLLTFRAGEFERGGGPRGTIQRIVPTTTPKQIDYRHAGTEKDVRGIYLVEGDVFVECSAPPGADRPTAFTSAKGSGHTLIVYKRVKKKID